MNDRHIQPGGRLCQFAGSNAVDLLGQFRLRLRLIDGGIGSSRNDDIRFCSLDGGKDLLRRRQIQLRATEGNDFELFGDGYPIDQATHHLAFLAGDHKSFAHHVHPAALMSDSKPRRPPS